MIADQVLSKYTGTEDNEIFSLLFHPAEQILLSTDVAGCVHFNLFDLESKTCSLPEGMGADPFKPHKGESCRAIDLLGSSEEGGYSIVPGGSDGRVVVSSFDPKVVSKYKFDNPINAVKCIGNNIILAGDDEGVLIGIDVRQEEKIFTVHEQEDYISSITCGSASSELKSVILTSGDCTLAVYDLRSISSTDKKRKDRLVAMSDQQADELNCAIVMNAEQHLLTGDANGVVGIWKQGYWGDLKDRIPLYQRSETPQGGMDGSHSIDGMMRIEEKQFIVATSDGMIRVVDMFPNQVDRVVGVHRGPDDAEIATMSGFACDVDLGLVATSGGESEGRIKFWNLNNQVEKEKAKKTAKPVIHPNAAKASKQSFFSDL